MPYGDAYAGIIVGGLVETECPPTMPVVFLALLFRLFAPLNRCIEACAMLFALAWRRGLNPRLRGYRRRPLSLPAFIRAPAKPAWVRKEIVRLKALMPQAGCRKIADTFNRRFARKHKMTVGKTFVSEVICRHRYDIEVERRRIKNARPKPVPKNLMWGMDLTGKPTLDGRARLVLGILDHGSRAALWLEALEEKSSWRLILKLVEAIKRYGKPHTVRTDNEAVVTSSLFRFALLLLGIRHQRTDPGCPWQNGRVERLFATLKEKLDALEVDSFDTLNQALGEFRFFYNHVRPHQNLNGQTPAEAWAGIDPFADSFKGEYWFEAWDGLLQGYYLRR